MRIHYFLSAIFFVLIFVSCDQCSLINSPVVEYQTGDTIWIHESPVKDSMYINSSLAIGSDGSIYYAASGGTLTWHPVQLFALNRDDGSLKWITEKMDANGLSSQIVVGDDGTIYAIGYHTLYAFDPANGSTKWKWEVPTTLPYKGNDVFVGGGIGDLALTNEGNLIFSSVESGVYSRTLFCLNPNSQTLVWYNMDVTNWGIPWGKFIGPNNMAFFYTDMTINNVEGKYIVGLNCANGSIAWNTKIGSNSSSSNNISIMNDGNLFCSFTLPGETDSKYRIVNSSNGNIIWTSSEKSNNGEKYISPDGKLYEEYGFLFEIDPANGAKSQIVGCEFGSITNNNRLVCAFTDADNIRKLGVFYQDGLQDYTIYMNGLEGQNLVIDNDSRIYGIINLHPVSRLPTKICALQGNSPLAKSGWPRRHHDNRNTSNWSKF